MSLMRGRLCAGALFAGLLLGGQQQEAQAIPDQSGGGLRYSQLLHHKLAEQKRHKLHEQALLVEAERRLTLQIEAATAARKARIEELASLARDIREQLASLESIPPILPIAADNLLPIGNIPKPSTEATYGAIYVAGTPVLAGGIEPGHVEPIRSNAVGILGHDAGLFDHVHPDTAALAQSDIAGGVGQDAIDAAINTENEEMIAILMILAEIA